MVALEYGVLFWLANGTGVEFTMRDPARRDRMVRIARVLGFAPVVRNRATNCRGCRPYTTGRGLTTQWRVLASGGERLQAAALGW
jgi:hypothetical protein